MAPRAVERRDGVKVLRFPFPVKLPPGRTLVATKWLANPITYLYAGLAVAWLVWHECPDVIHIQNKHMLIPGTIAGRLLHVPVFLTIRDGSIINGGTALPAPRDRRPPDCGVRKLWRECSEELFRPVREGPQSVSSGRSSRSSISGSTASSNSDFSGESLGHRRQQRHSRHLPAIGSPRDDRAHPHGLQPPAAGIGSERG